MRTDTYSTTSLEPTSSRKIRGSSGVLEHKARVGVVPVLLNGQAVSAEQWIKRRGSAQPPITRGVDVHKKRWRSHGVEIGSLRIFDERWWTVAVVLGEPADVLWFDELEPWMPVLTASGDPMSYPAWLLERYASYGVVAEDRPRRKRSSARERQTSAPSSSRQESERLA